MSKQHSFIVLIFGVMSAIALSPTFGSAQPAAAEITIDTQGRSALVKGEFPFVGQSADRQRSHFFFLKSAIGFADLGSRISEITLNDGKNEFKARRLTSTEFVAEKPFASFSYTVDLAPSGISRSAAHGSWIGQDVGLLMLDDILPLPNSDLVSTAIRLKIPEDWSVVTSENRMREGDPYSVGNISKAVFVIGKGLRSRPGPVAVSTAGTWHFSDAEVGSMADSIFAEYRRTFGGEASYQPRVVLLPFPQGNVPAGTWEAETRGSTVVLLSSDTAFKGQSLQRLHEQLRHELFHLWLPNGVDLTGPYDWFYEGFALYQSLRSGVRLNQIRFADMLDTLSRARGIERSIVGRRTLLAVSAERWKGSETEVYARGMLVAFLCDLAILDASKGRRTIEDVFRAIFESNKPPGGKRDGNEAVLKALVLNPETVAILNDHVRGTKAIDWRRYLDPAGLEDGPNGLRTKEKLSGSQKTLLDKLGYNAWRKLTEK